MRFARVVGDNDGSAGVTMEMRSCEVGVASAAYAQSHSQHGGKGGGKVGYPLAKA